MMNMNLFQLAKKLAMRPYLVMTAKSETTDGQPIYNARTLEIEGCIGQGDTPEQAVQDLRGALVDYIESLLEDGLDIPEPIQLVRTERTGISTTVTLSNRLGNYDVQQKHVKVQDSYVLIAHA